MLAGPITTFTSTIFPKQSRSKKTKKSIHMTIPKRHASTLSTFAFTNIRLKRFKKSPSHSNTTRAVSQHTQPLVRIYPLPLPPTLQPQNSHRTQTCHLPPYRNPTPEKYNSTTPKHTNLTTTTTPTTIINNTTHFRKTFRLMQLSIFLLPRFYTLSTSLTIPLVTHFTLPRLSLHVAGTSAIETIGGL